MSKFIEKTKTVWTKDLKKDILKVRYNLLVVGDFTKTYFTTMFIFLVQAVVTFLKIMTFKLLYFGTLKIMYF